MADVNSTIKTVVELDVTQAQQQIVKFNAKASDSTQELETRVEAKNQAVELQNKLSKQTVDGLEDELKALKEVEGTEKDIIKITKSLNREKIKATKLNENGIKQQKKLNSSLKDSKSATKDLDGATGGLLGKMKAFVTNPIGLAIIAITGAFTLLTKAIGRSKDATTTFSKIGAKLTGFFNGLLAVLEPVVEFLGEKFLQALENPMQLIEDLGNSIKQNILNRFEALTILGDAIVKLFEGDFDGALESAKEGFLQLATGIEDVEEKFKTFASKSAEAFSKAVAATESLVDSERRLVENRIALEKQQLISLNNAEKERQIRDDVSLSIEERIAANTRLGKSLEEQSRIETELAQIALDIALAQREANGDTIESVEAIGAAEVKLLEIQERITGQRSEQIVNEVGLLKERQDKIAEDIKLAEEQRVLDEEIAFEKRENQLELDEIELERLRNKGELTLEMEREFLEKKRLQDVSAAELTAEQIQIINERSADAKAAIDKKATDTNKKVVDKQASDGINAAAEAFGVSQELAVAEMIMAAPKAVGYSFAKASETYVPPLSLAMGALGAAGTLIPIIKGLNDIKKTRFSKKKGGGPKGGSISSSVSAPAVAAPTATTTAITDIEANNIARSGVDPSIIDGASAAAANNVSGAASQNIVFSESEYSDFQSQVEFKESKTTI